MVRGAEAYGRMNVATASPWQMIDMLYERAIRSIDDGNLARAREIVADGLLGSLNPDVELSKGYADVYDAALLLLSTKDPKQHAKARKCLQELHEAWRGIAPGLAA